MNLKFAMTTLAATFLLLLAPAGAIQVSYLEVTMAPWEAVNCDSPEVDAAHDAGLDPYTHTYIDPTQPDTTVTVHLLCLETLESQLNPLTDCTATSYSFTGWKWNVAENHRVDTWNPNGISSSTVLNRFQVSADAWDNQVAANIIGSFSSGGSRNNIPVYDGYNQHGWKDLSSSTIASTWTWSSGGVASESDAAYNTDFAWSSSGQSGRMDLQNIATHELGHTVGMGHSTTASGNSCLTMYPSGSLGETQKRTLGDGDINGIKARYP